MVLIEFAKQIRVRKAKETLSKRISLTIWALKCLIREAKTNNHYTRYRSVVYSTSTNTILPGASPKEMKNVKY